MISLKNVRRLEKNFVNWWNEFQVWKYCINSFSTILLFQNDFWSSNRKKRIFLRRILKHNLVINNSIVEQIFQEFHPYESRWLFSLHSPYTDVSKFEWKTEAISQMHLHISHSTRFRSRCQKTSYNSDAKSIFRVRGRECASGGGHTTRYGVLRFDPTPRARKSRGNLPGISMDRFESVRNYQCQ